MPSIPEVAFLLGKDTNTFRDLLGALTKGSEATAHRRRRPTLTRDQGEADRAG
jgi:hypothetical protein